METMFKNKNVIVLGLAKSGFSTALLLLKSGANVIISALKKDINDSNIELLHTLGAKIIWGPHSIELLNNNIDFIVKNPGIPYSIPFLIESKKRNIPIYSEVEITSPFLKDTIAITGSNGKTTTTTLIQNILSLHKDTIACGNIGRPLSDVVVKGEQDKTLVMELSSFQLKGTRTFKPFISIFLNINESHLDYHKDMNDYVLSKSMITKNQTADDFLIYNIEDPILRDVATTTNANTIPFSTDNFNTEGACVKEGWIYYKGERFMETNKVALPGIHNLQNILSALIVAKLHNIPEDSIKHVFATFSGVEHRLQYVTTIKNRKFYNDSKATNIPAANNAVLSFEHSPILIAGGLDRGNSFDEFIPTLRKCKAVFVYGQTADKIVNTATDHQLNHVFKVNSLEEAVVKSYEESSDKDIILLSPACASWDQFKSFEERGNQFISYINQLKQTKDVLI
ncbi:UDP-N-acetylmuramoyl-L-alanine--D-glutamate ligase [Bacillus thuringiensis]|uniref:UDP-N-acetylmuramoyl-L-alanine--D-glutamate ligase n=1 Tax=Bacillus thuringiensis TaxID=1428 RepID=UPI0021D66D7A|nr:UDP-N-acetylmuramoyl-L-alanine--D-glutamate ligase [Bacillus thuringiensis]MCU7667189.1 UDP-N-acetylmuramoyl-L-alanine--D-glutamate ligase [Bacillus thuringiensis]